jgi:hypothetical protein
MQEVLSMTVDPNAPPRGQEFYDLRLFEEPKRRRWLAPAIPAQLPIDLLCPYLAEGMKEWKVGPDIGNVRNNRPDLVEPPAT